MSKAENWFHRMQRGETPPPPIAAWLGQSLRRVDLQEGELEADFRAGPEFGNPAGTVQGGMLGAMLDALTASLVDATAEPGQQVLTLNLHLSFPRPARPGLLAGHARLLRRGREVCYVAGTLSQDGVAVAHATATCLLRGARSDSPAQDTP